MARKRDTRFDAMMIEQFCLNKTINDVYRLINLQVRMRGERDVLSYNTVKNRYKEWLNNGSPGKLTLVETHKLDNGDVLFIYRDAHNNKWTSGEVATE